MCQVLGVSKSGYYKWLNGEPSKRTIENQDLTHKIRDIHARSRRTYGSPRITEDLRAQGTEVSRVRVARLMRRANIRSEIPKKFKVTTDSRHEYPVADNLLDRNFQPGEIGQACVSDITYIWTKQGWLYLTVILDLASGTYYGLDPVGARMWQLMADGQTLAAICDTMIINRRALAEASSNEPAITL